jgi:hypothetical protein
VGKRRSKRVDRAWASPEYIGVVRIFGRGLEKTGADGTLEFEWCVNQERHELQTPEPKIGTPPAKSRNDGRLDRQ